MDTHYQHNVTEGREGLPGWCYTNPELYELECNTLFRQYWQLVCHISDLPSPGDFITFDLVGERALIIRGQDGVVRAFHNLCRHRGSRVVAEEKGNCPGVVTCPFHAWSFELDGRLRSPAKPRSFPQLDPVEWGLKPVEMEIWHGFVFIRFQEGPQPSIAKVLKRFEREASAYHLEDLCPSEDGIYLMENAQVNWKSVRDVDNEGYHVPMAHPGLHDLYGKDYVDDAMVGDTFRSVGVLNDGPARLWSVRNYRKLLDHLPEPWRSLPRQWVYMGIYPNSVLALYPDSVIFYQDIPLGVDKTAIRGAIYRRADEDRVTRAARYLSSRIDNLTAEEDRMLTVWVQEAIQSSAFDGVILSDLESGVRSYHDRLRKAMPVMAREEEPPAGTLLECNQSLAENQDGKYG
ncbi:aromatic ring-hydroxylating dioxygenase subunit alpha [Alphaproteobacteria bacterium LSUCC0684]